MLGITLDRAANLSLARQLTDQLRARIRRGELAGGLRLPATRLLAESLGVSRTVALEAYEQLKAEGYLEGRAGSGCYVGAGVRLEPRPRAALAALPVPPAPPRGCISFATGLPALELIPWDAWGRALKQAAPRLARVGYGEPEGLPELREQLAAYLYRARGLRAEPEEICITSGSTQALALLTGLCCGPGAGALIEDPCHLAMRRLLAAAGAPILPHPVDTQGLVLEGLPERAPGLVYVTPSHQFPLGGVLPAARRTRLLAWARAHRTLVLEDDYDGEFRHGGQPLLPLRESDPEGVACVGTLSKAFSPALRLGWVILPAALRARWVEAKRHSDCHTPLLEQAALAQFLASGRMEQHVHRMRKVYAARRAALLDALERAFPGRIEVLGAAAGIHLAARFPGRAFSPEVLARLQAAGVAVTPASAHALADPAAYLDTVLLGYGNLDERQLREGVRRMRAVLDGPAPAGRP
jgi:GntR family transcriptional regulator/MocR family aminotransferase